MCRVGLSNMYQYKYSAVARTLNNFTRWTCYLPTEKEIYPFYCCSAQRVKPQLSVWKQTEKQGKLEARDGRQRGISRGMLRAWFGREKLHSQDLSHLICVNHQVWGVIASWSFTSSLLHGQQGAGQQDCHWVKSCRETNEQHFLFFSERWHVLHRESWQRTGYTVS